MNNIIIKEASVGERLNPPDLGQICRSKGETKDETQETLLNVRHLVCVGIIAGSNPATRIICTRSGKWKSRRFASVRLRVRISPGTLLNASVAQLVEYSAVNRDVTCSNHVRSVICTGMIVRSFSSTGIYNSRQLNSREC